MKIISITTLSLILLLSGCASTQLDTTPSNPSEIVTAMSSLRLRWEKGVLPEDDWPDAIRELKPVQVYNDRVNPVIVLSKNDSIEKGIYVYIPISSYLPSDGDGWTFEKIEDDIWKYTRKISEPVD